MENNDNNKIKNEDINIPFMNTSFIDNDNKKNINKTFALNDKERELLFKELIANASLKKAKKKIEPLELLEDDNETEEEDEDSIVFLHKNDKKRDKIKGLLKDVIKTKKTNDWIEYMNTFKKEVKDKQAFCNKLKTIFHKESNFVIITKTIIRIFHIFFTFIFFIKYLFCNVVYFESTLLIPKRFMVIYL